MVWESNGNEIKTPAWEWEWKGVGINTGGNVGMGMTAIPTGKIHTEFFTPRLRRGRDLSTVEPFHHYLNDECFRLIFKVL